MAEATPVMRQYQALKERYPGALLFFRLGDFFELFGEDAQLAARELDLVLTSRDGETPMCGVPRHALDTYLGRLMEKGYRVALAEQMESAGQAKGLVRREVVRLVTPATWVEGGEDRISRLAAVATSAEGSAVAWLEPAAGRFEASVFGGPDHLDQALRWAEHLAPVEWVAVGELAAHRLAGLAATNPDGLPPADQTALLAMTSHLDGWPEVVQAAVRAGADYLLRTHPGAGRAMERAHLAAVGGEMEIDPGTWRQLEITRRASGERGSGTLISVLDETLTGPGRHALISWLEAPLADIPAIRHRQQAVSALVRDGVLRAQLRRELAPVKDIQRTLAKAAIGVLAPADLIRLAATLEAASRLEGRLAGQGGLLGELGADLAAPRELAGRIGRTIVDQPPLQWRDGGFVRPGATEELDRLRSLEEDSHQLMLALEQRLRMETGIRNLKLGYNRVFGYYLEVARSQLDLVPHSWVHKQTVAGGERLLTPELKELEASILGAGEAALALEMEVLQGLTEALLAEREALGRVGRALAAVDGLQSLAEVAVRRRYACPQIVAEPTLSIQEGRHPVVEAEAGNFVPNDLVLDAETRLLIVTGPNMGGKSTYLRQAALIVLLAQIGSFVPAKAATVGLVDRLFSRIGSGDDLAGGRSTFFMEMEEVAHILERATAQSLVLLDEVGRGTSTYDGIAVAQAVVEHLHQENRCRALVATHFLELTALSRQLPGVANRAVTALEQGERVVFLRRVVEGTADRSYGVHVAGLAGVPPAVLARARQILEELEVSSEERVRWDSQQLRFALHEPVARLEPEALRRLRELNPDEITPRQALQILFELHHLAEEEPS